MKKMQTDRRSFFKAGIALLQLAPFATLITSRVGFAADRKMVDENADPVAKALKYHSDATKADRADKTISGKKYAAAKQHCKTCALFTADGEIGKEKVGKCTMISGGLVNENGYCMSWQPNPNSKDL